MQTMEQLKRVKVEEITIMCFSFYNSFRRAIYGFSLIHKSFICSFSKKESNDMQKPYFFHRKSTVFIYKNHAFYKQGIFFFFR